MECTKDKWEIVGNSIYSRLLIDQPEIVCYVQDPNKDANARLIVAAANACKEINPDNPMAVAESIKELYKACKSWDRLWEMRPLDSGADIQQILRKCYKITQQAIAKVEK